MMTSAPRYNPHYTVADYEQWQGDWELWNGVAVAMSPSAGFTHQRVLARLLYLFQDAFSANGSCHCQVVTDVDWRVTTDTVVRPDLSVVCEEQDGEFITRPPTLIAEVLSPSTASKDRIEKRALYESRGVHWYLIIDPEEQAVDAMHLSGERYQTDSGNESAIEITLQDGCRVAVNRDALFSA